MSTQGDFLARARNWGATLMFLAGLLGILGSFLDWVSVDPPPEIPPGRATEVEVEEINVTETFTGVEAGDGWWVVGAAVVLVVAGVLLVLGRRTGWLAFFATLPIGGIAVADYREISSLEDAGPALGLTLVALAALLGLIGSVVAIAASPTLPDHPEERPA